MRVEVNHYDASRKDSRIVTLATVECDSIHQKGILIESIHTFESIHTSIGKTLTIYVTEMPARIDKQGVIVFLVDAKFAKSHPEPYYLYDNTKLFGEPETIWRNRGREPVSTRGSK